jgi:hypothetical protein
MAVFVLLCTLSSCECGCNIKSFEDAEKFANEGKLKEEPDFTSWNQSINELLKKQVNESQKMTQTLISYIITYGIKDEVGKDNIAMLASRVNFTRMNQFDTSVITDIQLNYLHVPEQIVTGIKTRQKEMLIRLEMAENEAELEELEQEVAKDNLLVTKLQLENPLLSKAFKKKRSQLNFAESIDFQAKHPTYESIPSDAVNPKWFDEVSFENYYLKILQNFVEKQSLDDIIADSNIDRYIKILPENTATKVTSRVRNIARAKFVQAISSASFESALRLYHKYVFNPEGEEETLLEDNAFEIDCIKIMIQKADKQKEFDLVKELIENIGNEADKEALKVLIIKKS